MIKLTESEEGTSKGFPGLTSDVVRLGFPSPTNNSLIPVWYPIIQLSSDSSPRDTASGSTGYGLSPTKLSLTTSL